MQIKAAHPDEYVNLISEERQTAFAKLRNTILKNLPEGFQETMSYGMIGYVVPHDIYPQGYHVKPELPLPFVSIASQKNFVAFYHMGMYADEKLYNWFTEEYKKRCKYKLDMGKSCVRMKRMDDIPFDLIGEVMQKMSVQDWIALYEKRNEK